MGANPHAFCPPALLYPPRGVRYLVSHMATSTQCRIHQLLPVGSAARSGSSVPEYLSAQPPKRDIVCVVRADAAFARRRRSSRRLCDNQCGAAGQKRTKYATLIRRRAVAARGALRRFALIGRCHIHLSSHAPNFPTRLGGHTGWVLRMRRPSERERIKETSHSSEMRPWQQPQPLPKS